MKRDMGEKEQERLKADDGIVEEEIDDIAEIVNEEKESEGKGTESESVASEEEVEEEKPVDVDGEERGERDRNKRGRIEALKSRLKSKTPPLNNLGKLGKRAKIIVGVVGVVAAFFLFALIFGGNSDDMDREETAPPPPPLSSTGVPDRVTPAGTPVPVEVLPQEQMQGQALYGSPPTVPTVGAPSPLPESAGAGLKLSDPPATPAKEPVREDRVEVEDGAVEISGKEKETEVLAKVSPPPSPPPAQMQVQVQGEERRTVLHKTKEAKEVQKPEEPAPAPVAEAPKSGAPRKEGDAGQEPEAKGSKGKESKKADKADKKHKSAGLSERLRKKHSPKEKGKEQTKRRDERKKSSPVLLVEEIYPGMFFSHKGRNYWEGDRFMNGRIVRIGSYYVLLRTGDRTVRYRVKKGTGH